MAIGIIIKRGISADKEMEPDKSHVIENEKDSLLGFRDNKTAPYSEKDGVDMVEMVPAMLCVFLGTALLMIIVFVLLKFCRRHQCCRYDNTQDTHYNAQNPHPPPYNAQITDYRHEDNCSLFHTHCDMGVQHYIHRPTHPDMQVPPIHCVDNQQQAVQSQNSTLNNETVNPVYIEESEGSVEGSSELNSSSDSGMEIHDLYKLTDRSITQTLSGKLIVSVTHLVDHLGDVLILDNMGISLKVPQGAIRRGNKQIIFLVLNWDLSDNPDMKNEESLVSPVVYVGPHGLKLRKPCTLIFRHCSYNTRHVRIMRSETELHVRKNWNVLYDQNDVTDSCFMTSDECQLKIDSFTLYTCVQAPLENIIGKKWLQIAVFACPLRRENNHHQIRVYFLNKTPCALQWAIQNEANFGGKMICPEKVFLFDGNALDMFAKTRYISEQWRLVDSVDIEKISFIKIWHGQCPHIAICYRRCQSNVVTEGNSSLAIEMNLQLFTYQNMREDDGEKIVIQVTEDSVTPKTNQESVCTRHHIGKIVIDIDPNRPRDNDHLGQGHSQGQMHVQSNVSRGEGHQRCQGNGNHDTIRCDSNSENNREAYHTNGLGGSTSSLEVVVRTNSCPHRDDRFDVSPDTNTREIPHALRKQLKIMLDAKHMFGSDWRDLAEKVGLDSCIPILREQDSPTEKILDVAGQKGITLAMLKDLLYSIDREDCALEVDKYLQRQPSSQTAVEHGDSSQFYAQENVTLYQPQHSVCRSYRSLQERSFYDSNRENMLSNCSSVGENWLLYPRNIPN